MTGTSRDERLARNEAFFRSINERIRGAVDRFQSDGHVYAFVCECADPGCMDRVSLSVAEYESVRADGTRFVVAPGHDVASIEDVVQETGDHMLVEKTGTAADVAVALDPRAA
jgi:hypothetical protein